MTSDATSSHIRDEGAIATCIAIADALKASTDNALKASTDNAVLTMLVHVGN